MAAETARPDATRNGTNGVAAESEGDEETTEGPTLRARHCTRLIGPDYSTPTRDRKHTPVGVFNSVWGQIQ